MHKNSYCHILKKGTHKIYFIFYSLERQIPATVKEAANLFKNECYEKRDEAIAGIICAGWDEREGGQVCFVSFEIICKPIFLFSISRNKHINLLP